MKKDSKLWKTKEPNRFNFPQVIWIRGKYCDCISILIPGSDIEISSLFNAALAPLESVHAGTRKFKLDDILDPYHHIKNENLQSFISSFKIDSIFSCMKWFIYDHIDG